MRMSVSILQNRWAFVSCGESECVVFSIGIFGCNPFEKGLIKDTIHKLSFLHDMEIGTYWFDTEVPTSKLEPYLQKLQIAIISIRSSSGESIGKYIYQENPGCLICFCGEKQEPIKLPLLSRPISYHTWENQNISDFAENKTELLDRKIDKALLKKLSFMIIDSKRVNTLFCTESKRTQISMPICNILYFQSDLKYIILHCKNGENYRFFGKLSNVQELLSVDNTLDLFLSTHKSYLVNRMYIASVDKNSKSIHLLTGEDLPISTAQYNHVLEQLFLK